jgi:hypothetical protein
VVTAGAPGTLTTYFAETDPPKMADEAEAAAKEYQRLFGKRPNFVVLHTRIGTALERHLTYNFFDKEHQIRTQWHHDENLKKIILTDQVD